MKKIISNILSKYSQLINTYYDEDNFNVPVFKVLLKLEKEEIKEMGIQKSIKVISSRLSILMGYVTFLHNRYIEKLPFSKEVIKNLKKYARKGDKKYLNFGKFSPQEKQKIIDSLFIIGPLTEVIDHFMMIKCGYINELEKFFQEKIGDKRERMIRQEQMDKFDSSYHFSYIIENKIFRYRAMLYFYSCIKKENFDSLENTEQEYLKKIFRNLLKKYDISKNHIKSDFLKIESVKYPKILCKKISIDTVVQGFKEFSSASGLNSEVSTSKNYTNFAANFHQIKVPTGPAFSQITIYEFLKLCTHEIETHGFCFQNTLLSTGQKITLPQNNVRDEGLAKLHELLLLKSMKKKIKPNHNMLRVFIGKELRGKQYHFFLKLLEKVDGKAKGLDKRFLRYKKFYSYDLQGSFSKDVCYDIGTYWARKHLDSLKNEVSIIPYLSLQFLRSGHKNIYFSEVFLRGILEKNNIDQKNNKEVIKFFIKKGFIFRGFYSDYILHNLLHKEYIEEDFIRMMKKNYYFLPSDAIIYFTKYIPKEKLDKIVNLLKKNLYIDS